MASNYKEAYSATCKFEGGYANDKNDTGGETYKGIARNYWPKWAGWKTVDASKVNGILSANAEAKLLKDASLNKLVEDFYYKNFWVATGCDQIQDTIAGRGIAKEAFDTAVNMGVSVAISMLEASMKLRQTGKLSETLLTALRKVH
jgi:lysozyme family protein